MTSGGIDVASMAVVPESQPTDMEAHEHDTGHQARPAGQPAQAPPVTAHPMDALRAMQISASTAAASSTASAAGASSLSSNHAMLPPAPVRRVERNKSGGGRLMRARAPPKRSQSHKIGRPAFDPSAPSEPVRGVNRSHSNRVKGAPGRSGSFNRRAPNRSSSTSSLRGQQRRQHQQAAALGGGDAGAPDDISVSDSVFTSASNQTLDSIMLRKKQIDHGPDGNILPGGVMRGQRPNGRVVSNGSVVSEIEFDESLHTVDSMHLNRNHNPHHHHNNEEYYDDQCDMSIFSESFCSSETDYEELSDYDEEQDGDFLDGPIKEDEETTVSKTNDEEDVDESME